MAKIEPQEAALRVAHKDGKVLIMTTIGGEEARIELSPFDALTHAQHVMKHADLAREQELAQTTGGTK